MYSAFIDLCENKDFSMVQLATYESKWIPSEESTFEVKLK